jgi:UDP-N-acetylglucosamine--N-acetylmuramyl-(pentapeptide) pyrophosphoryl-undecaprenol N-acetylglucosamine transferase
MMASSSPMVVLTAGGTAGHVYPAEALAVELLQRGCRLALITDSRGDGFGTSLERVETHRIQAGGIAAKSLMSRFKSVSKLAIGFLQSRGLLKRLNPGVVVGFGGYASAPAMLAAALGGRKTIIHEQNAVLGRANRLLAPRVETIASSFDALEGVSLDVSSKVSKTGMPVRPAIAAVRNQPYPSLGKEDALNLLVIGGSQGASVLSEVVPRAVSLLSETWRSRLRICQQCRPEDLEQTDAFYRDLGVNAEVARFFDDIPQRLAKAHVVIARAGASTVAEASAAGRPLILVPYPYAVDDHQTLNARAVEAAGAGWLMPQESFTPQALSVKLESLFDLPALLQKAAASAKAFGSIDAAERLADMVFEQLSGNGQVGAKEAAL